MTHQLLILTYQDHVEHPLAIQCDGATQAVESDDQEAVRIPVPHTILIVDCVTCGCRLLEGEDFELSAPPTAPWAPAS